MRYPRPLGEDEVDRAGVEVRQRMELTATNRSYAYPRRKGKEKDVWKVSVCGFEGACARTLNENKRQRSSNLVGGLQGHLTKASRKAQLGVSDNCGTSE